MRINGLAAAVALFVVVASEINADPLASSEKVATTIWASAVAADYITTVRLLNAGGRERAPHLAWLQHKPTTMVAVGAGIDAGSWWLFKHAFVDDAENTKVRWLFRAALYASAGFRVYHAVDNYQHYKARRVQR